MLAFLGWQLSEHEVYVAGAYLDSISLPSRGGENERLMFKAELHTVLRHV